MSSSHDTLKIGHAGPILGERKKVERKDHLTLSIILTLVVVGRAKSLKQLEHMLRS